MSDNKKHIQYSAADIEKYHQGRMTPPEMNALEKAALDDPFLADALEGYGNTRVNITTDLADLEERLNQRTKKEESRVVALPSQKPKFYWWKLAAMIILIAGVGIVIYQLAFNNKPGDLAQAVEKNTSSPDTAATLKEATQDTSTGVVADTPQPDKADESRSKSSGEAKKPESPKKEVKKTHARDEISQPPAAAPATTPAGKAVAETDPDDTNKVAEYRDLANNTVTPPAAKAEALAAARQKSVRPVESYYKSQLNNAYLFRGRVTDRNNNALPFSNIMNTNDSIGTYADVNGYFNLVSTDSVLNVKISSVGFEPKIVSLQKDAQTHLVRLANDSLGVSHILISSEKVKARRNTDNLVLGEAEPADGWGNYDLYIANNLQEPDYVKERKIDGMRGEVVLSFEVSTTGEPINITVKKSLCEACDREAIRLLKEGPKWKKKTRKGKATVTIRF